MIKNEEDALEDAKQPLKEKKGMGTGFACGRWASSWLMKNERGREGERERGMERAQAERQRGRKTRVDRGCLGACCLWLLPKSFAARPSEPQGSHRVRPAPITGHLLEGASLYRIMLRHKSPQSQTLNSVAPMS